MKHLKSKDLRCEAQGMESPCKEMVQISMVKNLNEGFKMTNFKFQEIDKSKETISYKLSRSKMYQGKGEYAAIPREVLWGEPVDTKPEDVEMEILKYRQRHKEEVRDPHPDIKKEEPIAVLW